MDDEIQSLLNNIENDLKFDYNDKELLKNQCNEFINKKIHELEEIKLNLVHKKINLILKNVGDKIIKKFKLNENKIYDIINLELLNGTNKDNIIEIIEEEDNKKKEDDKKEDDKKEDNKKKEDDKKKDKKSKKDKNSQKKNINNLECKFCIGTKANGTICNRKIKVGDYCGYHIKDKK